MILEHQFRIKSNPIYFEYLKEHSYWYKILNRSKESFPLFEEEVKNTYKLHTSDRIKKALDMMDVVSALMSSLK